MARGRPTTGSNAHATWQGAVPRDTMTWANAKRGDTAVRQWVYSAPSPPAPPTLELSVHSRRSGLATPQVISRSAAGDSATLSRDLADFLVEFSISLHKNAIYPSGHPLLATALAGLTHRLRTLLHERSSLSIGVARQQLVIEGVATDANHPLLRELAQKLHAHQLGALRFASGVDVGELSDVLRTIAVDPGRSERPLGLEPAAELQRWAHVRLYPLTFETLELLEDDAARTDDEDFGGGPVSEASGPSKLGRTRGAQLWIGLARAALAADTMDGASRDAAAQDAAARDGGAPDGGARDPSASEPHWGSSDPVVVAKAIDDHSRDDQAYDQVVVGYLLQIAEELRTKGGHEAASLRRRISQLVGTLQPETLRRLLEMGGDMMQRRRFVLDASQGLAVDAVVDLVQAAATTSHQTISHSMIRLLSKFAVHAEQGSTPARAEANSALRDGVRQLIDGWQLEDPNPDAYRKALDGMSRSAPIFSAADSSFVCEPERMIQMSLEAGAVGEALWRATDAVINRRGVSTVLDILDSAPDSFARTAMYERYLTPEQMHLLLQARPVDFVLIGRVAPHLGLAAVRPLLDALEVADDRDVPAIAESVTQLGADAGVLVAERLPHARWALQRRLLGVLYQMPELPSGFSAAAYLQVPEARVRREALRLLLRLPSERSNALSVALMDSDEDVVRAALAVIAKECPPDVAMLLMERVRHRAFSPALQGAAVRAMAAHEFPETLDWLTALVVERTGWLRRLKLRAKTPELLAAVSQLATLGREHQDAQRALSMASASADPEIRAAAATPARRAS